MSSFRSLLQSSRLDTVTDKVGYRWYQLPSGSEYWKEGEFLGQGGCGSVYEEICLSGPSKNAVRAVKHITKHQSTLPETNRELKALVTFSDSKFPEVGA